LLKSFVNFLGGHGSISLDDHMSLKVLQNTSATFHSFVWAI